MSNRLEVYMQTKHFIMIVLICIGSLNAQQTEIITSVPINGALGLKFGMNRYQVEDIVKQSGWRIREPLEGLEELSSDCILLRDVTVAERHMAAQVDLCFLYDELSRIRMNFSADLYEGYSNLGENVYKAGSEEHIKISAFKGTLVALLEEDVSTKYGKYNVMDDHYSWYDPLTEINVPSIYWKDEAGNTIHLWVIEAGVVGYLDLDYQFLRNHERMMNDKKKTIERDF